VAEGDASCPFLPFKAHDKPGETLVFGVDIGVAIAGHVRLARKQAQAPER